MQHQRCGREGEAGKRREEPAWEEKVCRCSARCPGAWPIHQRPPRGERRGACSQPAVHTRWGGGEEGGGCAGWKWLREPKGNRGTQGYLGSLSRPPLLGPKSLGKVGARHP